MMHLKKGISLERLKKNFGRPFRRYINTHRIWRDFRQFQQMAALNPRFNLDWRNRILITNEKTQKTEFARNYVYHTAWAARILQRYRPSLHIDIASSLYFSALVSAFVPIAFYDYRPADIFLNGLTSNHGDLMKLPFADASVESLSCMHVIEHVGLGRYGDPLDPDGDLKAIAELKRVVRPGGHLLFVVPTGQARICFNAHRVYGYRQVLSYFTDMTLLETALITENGKLPDGLVENAPEELFNQQSEGTGCYLFQRPVK